MPHRMFAAAHRALQRMRIALDAQLAVGTADRASGFTKRDLARALVAGGIEGAAAASSRPSIRGVSTGACSGIRSLLPVLAARSGADVLHAASGTLPLVRTLPTVVTVHDMAWAA